MFIPTVAKYKDDVATSLKIQRPLVEAGYGPGLMLVIKDGIKGVTEDAGRQYDNLRSISKEYEDFPIITLLSNIPIAEIDFLNNTNFAIEHVKKGIDFTHKLPIGKRKILTFHLNALVYEEEFLEKDKISWIDEFNRTILPALKEIADYAYCKKVDVMVETDPVPCYGDVGFTDSKEYRNRKLNELRSPFYLTSFWGFEEIRKCGLGICLDICHNRTIYETAQSRDFKGILHTSDIEELKDRSVFDDVKGLKSSDLVHLNDGSALYSRKNKTVFKEGVALGEGDISELDKILGYIDSNRIPWVLEINETDFRNRPNTKKSIEYILKA